MKRKHYRRCEEDERFFRLAVQDMRADQLIFVDEMHVTRRDVRRFRGWGLKGKRVVDRGITVGDKRFNVTAAMGINGFVCWDIAYVGDKQSGTHGTNTAEKFCYFVLVLLGRVLRPFPQAFSVIICDNASVHTVPDLEAIIIGQGNFMIYTP
eukprot:47525-Eustigmatos_ZCMA.PRE.1